MSCLIWINKQNNILKKALKIKSFKLKEITLIVSVTKKSQVQDTIIAMLVKMK
jgi:hypothetical protein